MIHELPTVLGWRAPSDLPFRLYMIQLNYSSSTLGYALGRTVQSNPELGNLLLSRVRSLPDSSLLRFLTAPETFFRLSSGIDNRPGDITVFLSDSLTAEYCRLGEEVDVSRGVWTALGDFFFPTHQHHSSEHSQNTVLRSPSLRNGIPVDFNSPYANGPLAGVSGPPMAFATGEAQLVLNRLNEALTGISSVSIQALDVLTYFTKVVIIRKDLTCRDSFMSSSSNTHNGRTVIVNPQLGRIDSVDLADALIHESIHSLLYTVELEYPFILDNSVASRLRVRSPWTGNDLPISSYLHACLVWYGLWRFWRLAVGSSAFPEEGVQRRLVISSHGFERGSLLTGLAQVFSVISQDLQDCIQVLQEIVLQSS